MSIGCHGNWPVSRLAFIVVLTKSQSTNVARKTLGVVGGLSSEASLLYARLIHEEMGRHLGGGHSANLRSASLDHHELVMRYTHGDWERLAGQLSEMARQLVNAGAEALLLDSSTLHIVAESMETAAGVPLLHVIEACERVVSADGITCVGLLGTRCIAEEAMWRDWLFKRVNIDIALPPKADRELVREIMDVELARGRIKEASRVTMIRTMKALKRAGARAVVVVAPELLPITFASDTTLGFYAAARLHTRAAVQWAFATVPQAA